MSMVIGKRWENPAALFGATFMRSTSKVALGQRSAAHGWLAVLTVASCIISSGTTRAAQECGPVPATTIVVCNNSGTPPTNVSPYANGINYDVTYPGSAIPPGGVDPSAGLNLTLTAPINASGADGISVLVRPPGVITEYTGPTFINTVNGSITVSGQTPDVNGAAGIHVVTNGSISITTGNITTFGDISGNGVSAASGTLGLVFVDTTNGTITTHGLGSIGVSAESTGGGTLNVQTRDINTTGDSGFGIFANGIGKTTLNTTSGTISTMGDDAAGVVAQVSNGPLLVQTGPVSTQGDNAQAIATFSFGAGSATIDTTAGAITTTGDFSGGVQGWAFGSGSLAITTANVKTSGYFADGIQAFSGGGGSVSVDTTRGLVSTAGDYSAGIAASTALSSAVTITSGNIATGGISAPGISSVGGGVVGIDSTAGMISTAGGSSSGIFALSTFQDYVATINTAAINTTGDGSFGVAAAALGLGGQPAGSIAVTNAGVISSTGAGAGGIVVTSQAPVGTGSGPVTVNANANISATGQNAVGISASSTAGLVNVNVASGVNVMGGWSANPSELSTQFSTSPDGGLIGSNLPAAGIVVFSGATSGSPAMTINNLGMIGALNDRAITMGSPCADVGGGSGGNNLTGGGGGGNNGGGNNGGGNNGASLESIKHFASAVLDWIVPSAHAAAPVTNPCLPGGLSAVQSLTVNNGATVNGYVTFWDGAVHTFNNAAAFNMRNFADTNGDGVRDTLSVAISDFGAPGGIFNNQAGGVVQPLPVSNPATVNATGEYIPTTGLDSRALDSSVYSMTQNPAITQSQFVNVATFTNSGTINLRNGVPGDVFVITGNPAAGGAPGTGVFVSNGGRLLVDATLNSGIPMNGQTNSIADVLVVDSTKLGSGATSVLVNQAGGLGALTTGNGIELVEVRNKAAGMSAAGVFTLGAPVLAGAYQYQLYQNGLGADVTDGNWYLRSSSMRPDVPLATALPGMAQRFGLSVLPTYDDRVGTEYVVPEAPAPTTYIWCKDPKVNFRCAVTPDKASYYKSSRSIENEILPHWAMWGRVFGEVGRSNPGDFAKNGPNYDWRLGGVQVGVDVYRTWRDIAGLYAGYGSMRGDVQNAGTSTRAGTDSFNGYSVGAYWTHHGAAGWYTDAVLQGTRYADMATASVLGERFSTQGWGFLASLEGGWKVPLASGWSVTPQAQVIYQDVMLDSGADQFGLIKYGAADAVYGRIGARVAHDWNAGTSSDPRLATVWARVNLWDSFNSHSTTTFSTLGNLSPVQVPGSFGGSWGQYGVGISGQVARNVSVSASGDYSVPFTGSGYALAARATLKVVW